MEGNETIETHRNPVSGAILDAAAALVSGHGLSGLTMIVQAAGIGRAALYKYFPYVVPSCWRGTSARFRATWQG